ncbi:hypothetical protein EVAR_89104_1 [Eumeta japonica]|uniref:Uncharacterized protein n=1 Tax=Eumeta variegata TaxID=151549 RepID=A0A4C1XGZ3_EUMVA|nr:hypothetical protein EVAR_89104_1 [Eumeta japonica]
MLTRRCSRALVYPSVSHLKTFIFDSKIKHSNLVCKQIMNIPPVGRVSETSRRHAVDYSVKFSSFVDTSVFSPNYFTANLSLVNAVEIRSLRSTCGVCLKDRRRNSEVRERCGLKEDVVTRVERGCGGLASGKDE